MLNLKLNLVEHVHGRARFEDLSVDPPDDRSLTPQLDLPEQMWRDLGIPVQIMVTVQVVTPDVSGEEVVDTGSGYRDPKTFFDGVSGVEITEHDLSCDEITTGTLGKPVTLGEDYER